MARVTKDSLLAQIDHLETALIGAQNDRSVLQEEVGDASTNKAILESRLLTKDEELVDAQDECARLAAHCDVSAEQIGEAIRRIRSLQNDVTDREQSIAQLQDYLRASGLELSDAERDEASAKRFAQESAADAARERLRAEQAEGIIEQYRVQYQQVVTERDSYSERLTRIQAAVGYEY